MNSLRASGQFKTEYVSDGYCLADEDTASTVEAHQSKGLEQYDLTQVGDGCWGSDEVMPKKTECISGVAGRVCSCACVELEDTRSLADGYCVPVSPFLGL